MTVSEILNVALWGLPILVVVVLWLARVEFLGRVNKEALILLREEHRSNYNTLTEAHKEILEKTMAQRERTAQMEVRMENVYLWMAEIKSYIKGENT